MSRKFGLAILWSLTVLAVGLAWFAPRPVVVAAAFITAVASVSPGQPRSLPVYPLLLMALAVLALGADRPPPSWLWWLFAFPVSLVLGLPVLPALVVASVLWIVIDARPAIALALLSAFLGVGQFLRLDTFAGLMFLAAAAVLAIPAVVRLRRQAVL